LAEHHHEKHSVTPLDLHAFASDFYPGLENALFCWRWFENEKHTRFKTLTIEDTNTPTVRTTTSGIHPLDFHGINGYKDDLNHTTKFQWRWLTRDEQTFRVVTVEDAQNETEVRHPDKVKPHHLLGTNGYSDDLTSNFCWRWLHFDNGNK